MSHASDFRSDTVTRPSPAMLEAMVAAELGDDVLDGDPTVRALEDGVAAWLGKPGALFVPSGTMANQVAIGAWTSPGDEVIVERSAHIVTWEAGALAANHGVQTLTLRADDGALDPDEVREAVRYPSIHSPRSALVCVEQTAMGNCRGPGGFVVPLEALQAVRAAAQDSGLRVHLDGARLANAVVASGIAAEIWAAVGDSVSICLSKGLGAPVGSVLAGPKDFLERARSVRKRLGGWMRQAGVLAAAGLHGLEHNLARLADDHALAAELARRLDELPGLTAWPEAVQTNVVVVGVEHPEHDAADLARALEEEGVRAYPMSARGLRFMTHLDVEPKDVERAVDALGRILS